MPDSGLRVRRETRTLPDGQAAASCIVTFKTKERRMDGPSGGTIEVNEEHEFTVSDGVVFSGLLSRLGLREDYAKQKRGAVWTIGDEARRSDCITAELAEVAGSRHSLGWFLELQIITENSDESVVQSIRARLLGLLDRCGLGPASIEGRYYAELLRS